LSANHIERFVLLCGHSVEQMRHDYGVDLLLFTYARDGSFENESVKIQLKATDTLPMLKDGQTIAFPVLRADLDYWLEEWLPVIFIVYDAPANRAFWIYIQAYFQRDRDFELSLAGDSITVHIDQSNIVNEEAIQQFAHFKAEILRQRPREIYYEL
jgi:hypothetical protein